MKVVDISAWQTNIDWQCLKDHGVQGVIIKIGERNSLDEMFITHVNNAVAYGIQYGVYYYAHACDEVGGIEEADIVNQWLKTYLRGETPPLGIWYDAEDQSMLNGKNPAYPAAYFIDSMLKYGYTYVGIYSSYNWLTNIMDLSILPSYVPFWTAQYNYQNDFKLENPNRICKMWQYTDRGQYGNMTLDTNEYYE